MEVQIQLGGPVVRPLATRAKGLVFDSLTTQHIQRLISRALTYGAVGSLVLIWSWAWIHFLDSLTWIHFLLVPLNSIV